MHKLLIIVCASVALLAGCSGNGNLAAANANGSGSGSGSGTGTGTGTGAVPSVSKVTVTTSSTSILSDGSTTATITALVVDSTNNLIAGVPVTFSASSGGIAVTQATTDTNGAATGTLSTAGDGTLRTITITAAASGKTGTATVQVVSGAASTSVQMGSPAGPSFKPSVIGISSTSLSAGGTTSLTVALQQSDGTLYSQPATVNFNSTCAAQNLATITSPVMTSTGVATATYAATGCSGKDTITATTKIGSNNLSANGTLTVAASSVGSIVYKGATYTIISLKGSGTAAHPETSTVTFQVLDSSGGPSSGASVSFALDTSVGGVNVTPGPVKSDVNGNATTVVQAGTVATPVRVTATVLNTTPTISTQSNQLSVSTGIPTQDAFSMAVSCHNVEAWDTDGVQVTVTARLADRFSNPVADGTAVQFNTEGGHIQPQCTTGTTATESGFCTVTWVSANPRPTVGLPPDPASIYYSKFPPPKGRPGRSTLIGMAIGEESFNDANGNGEFDPGETWTDLGERYRDDNGNGKYDNGEYFYDFNNTGVRDVADGLFNGVLCNDPAHCQAGKESTGIGINNLIIMSGSTPDLINPAPGTKLAAASIGAGSATYLFSVADLNANPMAAGTKVEASVTGTGVSMAQGAPTSYNYPCTTEPLTYGFSIAIDPNSAKPNTNATMYLTITSPAKVVSIATYTIPIVP